MMLLICWSVRKEIGQESVSRHLNGPKEQTHPHPTQMPMVFRCHSKQQEMLIVHLNLPGFSALPGEKEKENKVGTGKALLNSWSKPT